jgi:CRP-like cAMP-binding protein
MDNVAAVLSQLPLFTSLPTDAIAALADIMESGSLEEGDILFQQGDASGALFLITSGAVKIVLEDDEGEHLLRQIGPGEALGEMSLIDQSPRTATTIAISPVHYVVLYHQDFMDIVSALPSETMGVLRDVAANIRARKADLLKNLPLFSGLPDEVLGEIALKMTGDSIEQDEVLFRKGDDGNALFIVTKGWFKITTVDSQGGELILNQCGPGEAIGEMSLIDEEPRSASVIALSAAEVMKLAREDFLTVLAAYPSLAQLMMRKLSARMRFSTIYIEKAIEFAKHIADGDYNFVKSQIESSQSNIIEEHTSNDARATEMLTAFFRMVEGVQKREEDLQQQVRQLTIQIDHAKRQEEFEKTTGSDFFANLKAQAAKLREERDQDE